MGSYEMDTSKEEADELLEATEATFGLERDLQEALRKNIEQLEAGLSTTDGGKEMTIEAGRTDIVGEDAEGTTTVIELKAGTAPPKALTQLLAYMQAVGENETVRGILVAEDFHDRILHAVKAVPNVQLQKYSFEFSFSRVEWPTERAENQ
jgi:RecB family endonuclease NucS